MNRTKLTASLIGAFLFLLAFASLLYILLPHSQAEGYIADIYQDGTLLTSIPLYDVDASYTLTVTGASGCQNQVEVRPGSIGILSADCPDKLCVNQHSISFNGETIVCLPNKLVVKIVSGEEADVDIIA